jgi:hypothetical protein
MATADTCPVMSNLSFGSGGSSYSSSKAHLPHVSLLSQPGTRPGIRPVIRSPRRRSRPSVLRFPVAFRPPAFASWASCPARGFRPPYGRPTAPPPAARTRTGFPRSARARPGWVRASSVPRGRRCRRDRVWCPVAAAASQRPAPVTPALRSVPGCVYHEASTRIHSIRPSSLPLTCNPQTKRAVLGLFPELHTPRHQVPERMSGQGQVFDTDPSYVSGISRPPIGNHSQRATSCRNHRYT